MPNGIISSKGKITNILDDGTIFIKTRIEDLSKIKSNIVNIDFTDSRPITDKQRKMVWSMIAEIANWSGESKPSINEAMKMDFMELNDIEPFSLSNASVSIVREYQKFLIEFILENEVPTNRSMIDYSDDIEHYIYSCLLNKRCVICGRRSDLHHIDRVGMGRSRDDIMHTGLEALPLCREHHTEAHTMPDKEFFDKYHISGGVKIDSRIAKEYGLKE